VEALVKRCSCGGGDIGLAMPIAKGKFEEVNPAAPGFDLCGESR